MAKSLEYSLASSSIIAIISDQGPSTAWPRGWGNPTSPDVVPPRAHSFPGRAVYAISLL